MKKVLSLAVLAAVGLFALAAVAFGANTVAINASTSPTKSGTSSKPVPIGGTFGFQVDDPEATRPLALDKLTVTFNGIRLNTRQFKGCSIQKMTQERSDKGCPAESLVARGFANNLAGPANDRQNNQLKCYLTVNMYNVSSGRAALFVSGNPSPQGPSDPKHCPLPLAEPIPVSVARKAIGDSISFTIPQRLKFPGPGVRNSLVETKLTLLKKTKRVSGRTVGFFETVGRCTRGRRTVTAQFVNEGPTRITQSGFAKCSN